MIEPTDIETFVEELEDYSYVKQAGRCGPLVTARLNGDGREMTVIHRPIEEHGMVPVTVTWKDRRIQFLPEALIE